MALSNKIYKQTTKEKDQLINIEKHKKFKNI